MFSLLCWAGHSSTTGNKSIVAESRVRHSTDSSDCEAHWFALTVIREMRWRTNLRTQRFQSHAITVLNTIPLYAASHITLRRSGDKPITRVLPEMIPLSDFHKWIFRFHFTFTVPAADTKTVCQQRSTFSILSREVDWRMYEESIEEHIDVTKDEQFFEVGRQSLHKSTRTVCRCVG